MGDAVAVPALDQAGDDAMERLEEMMKKLRTEDLALHSELVVKKTANARVLLENVRLQWDMKKVVTENEETARLLSAERVK